MTETSTDLIPVPGTGEVIDLAGPTDMLAEAANNIAGLERELRAARATVADELIRRLDRENRRSAVVGAWKLEAQAPDATLDYDSDELAGVLATLVEDGKISDAVMASCLARKVSYEPRKRELTRLLGSPELSDEDRDAVRACLRETGRQRRLTVKAAA